MLTSNTTAEKSCFIRPYWALITIPRVRTKQAVLKIPVISIPSSFRRSKANVSCCKSQCTILHSPHQVCSWKFDGYWLVTDCCLYTPLAGPSLYGDSGAMTHDAEKPNLILIGQHSESDFRSITISRLVSLREILLKRFNYTCTLEKLERTSSE